MARLSSCLRPAVSHLSAFRSHLLASHSNDVYISACISGSRNRLHGSGVPLQKLVGRLPTEAKCCSTMMALPAATRPGSIVSYDQRMAFILPGHFHHLLTNEWSPYNGGSDQWRSVLDVIYGKAVMGLRIVSGACANAMACTTGSFSASPRRLILSWGIVYIGPDCYNS